MISDNMTHELTYDKYSLIMEITFLRERSCVTNKKIQYPKVNFRDYYFNNMYICFFLSSLIFI